MSDNIHVAVRVRPLILRERENKAGVQWQVENKTTIIQLDNNGKPIPNSSFVFDRVFDTHESNVCVYKEICHPIVESVMEGFNGTIFAYGQTSSGKTYTMNGTKDNPGVIVFTINSIFDAIENMPEREFLLRISYMEIYNESVSDLLAENISHNLRVYENMDGQVLVQDLKEETVTNYNQVINLWKQGEKNRHIGETTMNERSSRSHTIFRMIIESRKREDNLEDAVNVSQLNLIDLAGSERAGQTGATGERFKEGVHINKSLLMLGHVISRLSVDDRQFVNYRDSKLTRILQNSLGGNAKTAIICTVTPVSLQQTHSSLTFASHAKCIKNKPVINEVLTDAAMLRRYKKKIQQLNEELQAMKTGNPLEKVTAMERELEEKDRQLVELEKKIKEMTENLVVSGQATKNQQVRKSRRETWAGSLSHLSCHSNATRMNFNGNCEAHNFALPSLEEEIFDLSEAFYITSHLSEEDANFIELPPVIFEANLQVQEKLRETMDVKPAKVRRTVTFNIPLVETATQTEELSFCEEQSLQEVVEAYNALKSEYDKIMSDSEEIREFTKLEKQIFSSDSCRENEFISILYSHIKDQENHILEMRNIFTKKYCSPMRTPKVGCTIPNKTNDKISNLQHELHELKKQLDIKDKLVITMQQEKEGIAMQLEQALERNCRREEELGARLQEAYNERDEIKAQYLQFTRSEKNCKDIEEKNNNNNAVLHCQLSKFDLYKDKILFLEKDNKELKEEINLLLGQIENYNMERSELLSEVLTFYEPLNTLEAKVSSIVDSNLRLEKLVFELEQQNENIEHSSRLTCTEISNLETFNESYQNNLSESSPSKRDLKLMYMFEEAVLEDHISERLFNETMAKEYYYFYRLQCEYDLVIKNSIKEMDILKAEFVQKLFNINSIIEDALIIQDQKHKSLVTSVLKMMSVWSTELDVLRKSLKEKLNEIEKTALMEKSDVITSLTDKFKEFTCDILNLKGKQEACNKDIIRMKEITHGIDEKCQKKLDEIFRMQIEFEAEKWKQEQLKCELFEELYQIENNAREMEQEMREQLARCEQLDENRQKEDSYIIELEKQISSLLGRMDEKDDEIEKYKSSLAITLKELSSLTEQFTVKKEETKMKFICCLEKKKDVAVQCMIVNSNEDICTETEVIKNNEEKKNVEIQCLILNANTTDSEREKEDIQKELDELYENSEHYLNRLYKLECQNSYYQNKVKFLQEELNEKDEMLRMRENKVETAVQTDEARVIGNSRLSEDAFLQLQRNLGKQKIVVVDLKNQLAEERKTIKVSREENEFLNRKIHQLKLDIRRLQQPTETTFVEQTKEKPDESSPMKQIAELYERGGSGIINSVKFDIMESQVHTLEKEVRKLKKENSALKRKRLDSKEIEINKEEIENRNETHPSLTAGRIHTNPYHTEFLEEKVGNLSSSNPLQAITNNISKDSAKDNMEESYALYPQTSNLGLSQDCHVQ